jgi:hypothetical protein
MEVGQGQDILAVKRFEFANVEPRQLLVVHYNPSLSLEVLMFNESVLVLSYDGVKMAIVHSPVEEDEGRLTSTVHESRIDCIWWETRGRTDLMFMNALFNSSEPPIQVRAGYPRNGAVKGPTRMRVTSATAEVLHAASAAAATAAAEPPSSVGQERFTE